MGAVGEEIADGVGRCKCGSLKLVEEKTSYVFVKRKVDEETGDIVVTHEWEAPECDFKVTCVDCGAELSNEQLYDW